MKELGLYLLLINAAALALMLADKKSARARQWRIPETVLMSCALLGGSAGIFTGMLLFHHKTRHPKFYIGVPIILLLQTGIIVLFLH